MAFQAVVLFVIGQRHVTIGTLCNISARAATDKGRISSAIDKDHCLVAFGKRLVQSAQQLPTEDRQIAASDFFAHIDGIDRRHLLAVGALFKSNQTILSVFGFQIGIDRRRRTAEYQLGAVISGAEFRYLRSEIAGIAFADITAVMLLVDDNHAEIVNGRKNCRSRPQCDAGFPRSQPSPFVVSLAVRQSAVQ